jgi:2-polyprenyl-3-methyl-5-hydroxy-6-metoxy-1,4-benzoquinol methylase
MATIPYPSLYDLPFVKNYQDWTVREVLSKQIMKGNAVLDLSCADGLVDMLEASVHVMSRHYTRMLRRQGASKVVGVDESQFSISIAKSLEKEEQLGIEYHRNLTISQIL